MSRPTAERLAEIRSGVNFASQDDITELFSEIDHLTVERDAIIELIDGLSDGETLFDAIQFMHTEWEHYSKEMNRAGYVTIPNLTAERDAARSQVAALREAGGDLWTALLACQFPAGDTPEQVTARARRALDRWDTLCALTGQQQRGAEEA